MRFELFGQSDIGHVRSVNEDGFLILELSAVSSSGPLGAYLLAVADGLGGHAGGAVASSMAVDILQEEFRSFDGGGPGPFLEDAFGKINRAIFSRADREPACAGMGTTMAAALLLEDTAYVANVGDSRVYLFRDGGLSRITSDHSWAAEQRRRRLLSERQIRTSPFRAMITRSLGYAETVAVDLFDRTIAESDVLLLSTDGLHGILPEKRIARVLETSPDPESAGRTLIEEAKNAGGDDNITVVLASACPA